MQRTLFGLVIYLLLQITTGQIPCDTGWLLHGESCYSVSTSMATQQAAKDACSTMGGYLVKVDDQTEHEFLASLTMSTSALRDKDYWVQGDYIEGGFRYDDNSALIYANWRQGEPNNPGIENCLDIVTVSWTVSIKDRQWNDKECSGSVQYICEKVANGGTICDSGWNLFADSCYLIVSSTKNHANAKLGCENQNAELAKITSQEENDFLSSITNSTISLFDSDYWIQGGDSVNENKFVFDDGTPVVYTNWKPGNPNNEGNEDCLDIKGEVVNREFYDRKWNDKRCGNGVFFICEKEIQHPTVVPAWIQSNIGVQFVLLEGTEHALQKSRSSDRLRCSMQCGRNETCFAFSHRDDECKLLSRLCMISDVIPCYNKVLV